MLPIIQPAVSNQRKLTVVMSKEDSTLQQPSDQYMIIIFSSRAVPDLGSGSGRNPALFPNPAEIWLRQKSHRSQIVLPDLKSQFLKF